MSQLQFQTPDSFSTSLVERIVIGELICIAHGLNVCLTADSDFEIWHDYISVPQWVPSMKNLIICSIPDIFGRAYIVVMHLHYVSYGSILSMRQTDASAIERCRAISNICNSKRFSRVWMASEFVQGRKVVPMVQNYQLVEEALAGEKFGPYAALVNELETRWNHELSRKEFPQQLEALVGMGQNLVPWQLGPLSQVRKAFPEGHASFAAAHALLALRRITDPRDFFHALLSVLKTGLVETELASDPSEALHQVAMACINAGDFSPLFMLPAEVKAHESDEDLRPFGYHDIGSFSIGRVISPPLYSKAHARCDNAFLMAECLRTFQAVYYTSRVNMR